MIVSCVFTSAISASAKASYTIYTNTLIQATAGQNISIPVCISDNQGLMGFDISLTYDSSVLTPYVPADSEYSVISGDVLSGGFLADNFGGKGFVDGVMRVFWADANPTTKDGVLFYLNFAVNTKAMSSTAIQIDFDQSSTFNGNYDDVTLNCSDIDIVITNNEYDGKPIFSLNGNNASAGGQITLDISVENIGEMNTVMLNLPYDNTNLKYSGMTANGIEATASDTGSVIEISISRFINKEDGKKISLMFQTESFATSGKYSFTADYSHLTGVDRVLIKGTDIYIDETESSDSIVIYTDDEIKTEFGEDQLIVPLYIKHNTGLMGFTLTFEYDPAVLEAVSVAPGTAFKTNFSSNIAKKEKGVYTCLWFSEDDVTANGDYLTLIFNVLTEKETDGKIDISYKENDIISENDDGVKIHIPQINFKVNEVLLSSISVNRLPDKTTYFIGQSLDSTGLQIELIYNNGSSEIISSGFDINELDSSVAGPKSITVTYQEKTTVFNVTVKEKSLTKISVSKIPTKTSYYIGQELDTSGLELRAEYDDGSSETVTSGFTVSGFDSSTLGSNTVTINYFGKSAQFNVIITEAPTLLGDVDNDGVVSLIDATLIQRHLAEVKNEGIFDENAADCDRNSIIEIVDATWIQRFVALIDIPYSVGQPITD